MKDSVLVISEGPPPLGDTVAEGGALRAWGLAKGLAAHGHKITFAYRSTFKLGKNAERTTIPSGVTICTWDGKSIQYLLDEHKTIIMRYAMGEAALIVARLKDEHILVSDSYVPISVEVSARKSDDPDKQINYLRLQRSSAIAMQRADYILYASQSQLLYYLGYLAGLNKLSPETYEELSGRMFKVPYGIDPDDMPKSDLGTPKPLTLLWYGAFYSWFNIEPLIEPLKKIKQKYPDFKLIIAGAKNPYNKDPGLLAHYNRTIGQLKTLGDTVEYIPWGPYDERFQTYAQGSAIITYNHEGLENLLAWRTRLMDFVLSKRPILTNGGDPLGEDLIRDGIAFRINQENIVDIFEKVTANPPENALYQHVINRYSWVAITEMLAEVLSKPTSMTRADNAIKFSITHIIIHEMNTRFPRIMTGVRYIRTNGLIKTIQRITKG